MNNPVKNNIMIVDDEKSNILYLDNILCDDYEIFAAMSGSDAIEWANEFLPDLILLDIIMPEMDGYEVLGALKASEKARTIPVIFITGLSSSDDETKGLALGAEDYISKPFNDEIVKLRVKNQLKIINQMRTIIAKEISVHSSRLKIEFLSRMSHEMRTPMNAILGMAAVIQMEDDLELIYDHVKKIDASSRDLLRLIDNVLDIADMHDEKTNLEIASFDIRTLIREVLERSKESRKQKKQTCTVDIGDNVPQVIFSDPKRLAQIIENLLSNAFKFTGERGLIQIKLTATESQNETMTLRFEVKDNGIGISMEQQQGLFDLFEQVDGGEGRKYEGLGSGLFITKKLVEIMGGEITVESALGYGSNFVFSIEVISK